MNEQQTIASPRVPGVEPLRTTEPQRRKRLPIVVLALLAIGGTAYFLFARFMATPEIPRSIVALSGRIEGDVATVASRTSGRIKEVRVREGDQWVNGETVWYSVAGGGATS